MGLQLVADDGSKLTYLASGYTQSEEERLEAFVTVHRPRNAGEAIILISNWASEWGHLPVEEIWRRWGRQKPQVRGSVLALTTGPENTRLQRWARVVTELDGLIIEHANSLYCRKCLRDFTSDDEWAFVLLDGKQAPCHLEECCESI